MYDHITAQRDRYKAALESVLEQLNGGFVKCERCGSQEDTKDMDVVCEIKQALGLTE